MNNLRKFYSFIKKVLPHLTLILAAALIVLLIVNYYNPLMGFLENSMAHAIMYALAALSILLAIRTIYSDFKKEVII